MGKIHFSLTRMTALLLVLVCMLELLPAPALAASTSTIKMDDCAHSGTKYNSPALGKCYLHQMHFGLNGKSTMGFCVEKGKGIGWSLKGPHMGEPQPHLQSHRDHYDGLFLLPLRRCVRRLTHALGVDDVWSSNYTGRQTLGRRSSSGGTRPVCSPTP